MTLKGIILSEKNLITPNQFQLYEIFRIGDTTETESMLVVAYS